MRRNLFPLQNGKAIHLQGASYDGAALDFSMLALLTHTELLEATDPESDLVVMPIGSKIPAGAFLSYGSKSLQLVYEPELRQFRLYFLRENLPDSELYRVYLWQVSVICGCAASLLRGNPVMLMHCGMLERGDEALLLCGESGMGKSTSSRRWRESGGSAISDDMILVEFTEDSGVLVHRLPTWSACRVSLEGRSYPFNPPLKLKSILALSRSGEGEREHVRAITDMEYFAQVYRCAFFHYKEILRPLPADYMQESGIFLRKLTERLIEHCDPVCYFASLDGDICSTLKDYL